MVDLISSLLRGPKYKTVLSTERACPIISFASFTEVDLRRSSDGRFRYRDSFPYLWKWANALLRALGFFCSSSLSEMIILLVSSQVSSDRLGSVSNLWASSREVMKFSSNPLMEKADKCSRTAKLKSVASLYHSIFNSSDEIAPAPERSSIRLRYGSMAS